MRLTTQINNSILKTFNQSYYLKNQWSNQKSINPCYQKKKKIEWMILSKEEIILSIEEMILSNEEMILSIEEKFRF